MFQTSRWVSCWLPKARTKLPVLIRLFYNYKVSCTFLWSGYCQRKHTGPGGQQVWLVWWFLIFFLHFLIPLLVIWTVDVNSVLWKKECYSAPFELLSVAKGLTCSRTGVFGERGSGERQEEQQQGWVSTSGCLKQTWIIRKERRIMSA